MTEPKTKKTRASVAAFIAAVENNTRRKDAKVVDKIYREVTGKMPAMWGPTMIGYGDYESPTGTWPRAAFSPRKASLVLYVLDDYDGRDGLLQDLGKHKTGKSCLYINQLADVDAEVLRELIARCWKHANDKYG